MGDKHNAILPATQTRKDPRPLKPPAGSSEDLHQIITSTDERETEVAELQSQKPFASPGKLMDGKQHPVPAPPKPTSDPDPTE